MVFRALSAVNLVVFLQQTRMTVPLLLFFTILLLSRDDDGVEFAACELCFPDAFAAFFFFFFFHHSNRLAVFNAIAAASLSLKLLFKLCQVVAASAAGSALLGPAGLWLLRADAGAANGSANAGVAVVLLLCSKGLLLLLLLLLPDCWRRRHCCTARC